MKFFILFCVLIISFLCACNPNKIIIGSYLSLKDDGRLTITKDSFFYNLTFMTVGVEHCQIKGEYKISKKRRFVLKYRKAKIWGEESFSGKDSIKIAVFWDNMEPLSIGQISINEKYSTYLDVDGELSLSKKEIGESLKSILVYDVLFPKPITYTIEKENSDSILIFISEGYHGRCNFLDIGDYIVFEKNRAILWINSKKRTFTKK